jgi:hypothetical protein
MSIASELLISTRQPVGCPVREVGNNHLKNARVLEGLVFGLISEHEPCPGLCAELLRELRIMCLSGLVGGASADEMYHKYLRAAEDLRGVLQGIPDPVG